MSDECHGGGKDCDHRIVWSIENGRMSPPNRLRYSCGLHLHHTIVKLMDEGGGPSYQQCVQVGKWGSW